MDDVVGGFFWGLTGGAIGVGYMLPMSLMFLAIYLVVRKLNRRR